MEKRYTFFFLLLSFAAIAAKEQSISIKYLDAYQFFTVPITIGGQVFDVQFDTTTSETWVPSISTNYTVQPKYDASASATSTQTNKTFEINDEEGDVRGKAVYDTLKIGPYTIDQFGFVQVEHYPNDFTDYPKGKLGIGLNREHGEQFDLLRTLKNNKLINKEIITIDPFEKTLSIGDIPTKYNDTYTKCNATPREDLDDDYRSGWACEISHLYFGGRKEQETIDDATEVSVRAMFDSAYPYISMRKTFLATFKQNFITPIFNDTCTQVKESNEVFFLCDYNEELFSKAKLTFVMQGYGYVLDSTTLFAKKAENKYELLIRFCDENDDIWGFGAPFTSKHVMVYDQEDAQVGFFLGEKEDMTEEWTMWTNGETAQQKKDRMFMLILGASIIGGVLLLIVICLICRSCKKRKLSSECGPLMK